MLWFYINGFLYFSVMHVKTPSQQQRVDDEEKLRLVSIYSNSLIRAPDLPICTAYPCPILSWGTEQPRVY